MKIEILGTGCPKCEELAANAKAAADSLGVDYELVKVTSLKEIMNRGVMMTPGLVVDGEVKLTGKLASAAEIEKILAGS